MLRSGEKDEQGTCSASASRIPAADYVSVWQRVLKQWMDWPDDRVEKFVANWDDYLNANPSSSKAFWFYRELPFSYLTSILLSPALRSRFEGADRIEIERKMEQAVYQGDAHAHRRSDFDWTAARARVEKVLAQFDAALPTREDLTIDEEEEQRMPLAERIRILEDELKSRLPRREG